MLNLKQMHIAVADKRQQFNMAFNPGQIWAVLGANGSGKSTLLETLAALRQPQSGAIYLNQKKLSAISVRKRAQQIGLLLQHSRIVFPESVWDSVGKGDYPHQHDQSPLQQRIVDALAITGLTSRAQQCMTSLSGGELRRAGIARVLVQRPAIYLLDEPFNHLDVFHQFRIFQHLQTLAKQGCVIILVLHDVNLAMRFCTHALLLFDDATSTAGKINDVCDEHNLKKIYQREVASVETQLGLQWLVL